MLYPQNIEHKLGFDQIRDLIRKECLGLLGQTYIDKMKFSKDFDLIRKLVLQTSEFKKLLEQEQLFPTQNFLDVSSLLEKIKIEGLFLETQEFFDLKLSLKTLYKCLAFFDETNEFPTLKALTEGVTLDKKILYKIEEVIDDKGLIRDNASAELLSIRKELISEQAHIRKELDKILNAIKREGYADDEVAITIRNGRMVIPVFAEHKRKVKGFIHDESSTGQTVFIEPAQVLEINNEIRDLQYREKREIIRILSELTLYISPYYPELKRAYTFLGMIDFIRAKAKLAIKIGGILPVMVKQTVIDFKEARHPLLFLNFQLQQKSIVPLSIALNEDNRILVISGPNAGGKSVALKTVGLLQYMLQCGLLIPVREDSTAGIFQDILIDIGDEQSIENDLSTYSSHLTNMRQFLFYGNKRSLILIDEFGTGTEPNLGGAIAEAVLEGLNNLQVSGIITTHYSNLKTFTEKTPGLINGAMVFDLQKLEPLYELQIGKPGSSFALEIAKKIGLPENIIQNSKDKVGKDQVNFEKLIHELEAEKLKVKRLHDELSLKEKLLKIDVAKYESLYSELNNNRKLQLNDAKEKAKTLIQDAKRKIENTIREIKENKADKATTQQLRKELQEFDTSLQLEPTIPKPEQKMDVESGPIKVGDYVKVVGNGAYGKVVSLKDKDVELLIGELKSNVKLNRLEKVSRKEYKKQTGEENSVEFSRSNTSNEKMANFSPNIDLRGKRSEEAITEVDSLVDTALLFGVNELKIIHGKGDGILRTMIRNHLKNYKQIKSLSDEHADRGGAGVTLVHFH